MVEGKVSEQVSLHILKKMAYLHVPTYGNDKVLEHNTSCVKEKVTEQNFSVPCDVPKPMAVPIHKLSELGALHFKKGDGSPVPVNKEGGVLKRGGGGGPKEEAPELVLTEIDAEASKAGPGALHVKSKGFGRKFLHGRAVGSRGAVAESELPEIISVCVKEEASNEEVFINEDGIPSSAPVSALQSQLLWENMNASAYVTKSSKHFSKMEKSILFSLVEKHRAVLESKRSDARTISQKQKTWLLLGEEFNTQPGVVRRDPKQLRKCWENMKARAKKRSVAEKRERLRVPNEAALNNPVSEPFKMAAPVPAQLCPVQNPLSEGAEFDSGAPMHDSLPLLDNRRMELVPCQLPPDITIQLPEENHGKAGKNKTGLKTSVEETVVKMHIDEHHKQMALLNLQILQEKELHTTKMKHLQRSSEMAEEEHKLKLELLRKQLCFWGNKVTD
ncbi:myb/SANT-like DNA-binding domain-containing protein 3 isoform X1 [Latimeria chalumnae]|nr:PREDICTED: myb/SANT-like DNA-binding domain-containing protein 3 [Latimeria chalumnae]|eukprot:XP_006010335.1 PREDICTED: myb/SANT-like DNA-binding domain-containing protein 3 [Latimeria chalumnae]